MKLIATLILVAALPFVLAACEKSREKEVRAKAEKEHSDQVARLGYDPDKPASATNRKPYYIVTATYPKKRYSTTAYDVLPNGTVRFVHYESKREVVLSPPFEIEQRWMAAGH